MDSVMNAVCYERGFPSIWHVMNKACMSMVCCELALT